jgi:hypothetical protein
MAEVELMDDNREARDFHPKLQEVRFVYKELSHCSLICKLILRRRMRWDK